MLSKFIPAPITGLFSLGLHTINTFFWIFPIIAFALIKLLLPLPFITQFCNQILNFFASGWITINGVIHGLTKSIEWEFDLPEELSTKQWYLVIANHQSWVDILALQKAFNRQVPFLKFFLKQELIWVPVLGIAWWALDFPFMKRFSKSYLKKNPHKKGQDFETTRKACEKFKSIPISIMNFVEGTRLTPEKQTKQHSPFKHLLKPKSGGVGYVLSLMGTEINQMIDVTIHYPQGKQFSFWDFLCGKVTHVKLIAEIKDIPSDVKGNYTDDPEVRKQVQKWINQIWTEKDKKLDALKNPTQVSDLEISFKKSA